jgi:hypothetical protein
MGIVIRPLFQILIRAAFAMLCAVLVVGAAILATNLTTAPKSVSLLLEPISLLLMPGLLASILTAGPHDYSPHTVANVSFVFYAVFFYGALHWLSRRRNLR